MMTDKHRLFDLNRPRLEFKGETYVPHLSTN